MKTIWTSLEADTITGGASTLPWRASGIALGLNETKPGDLFFAAHMADAQRGFDQGAAVCVLAQRQNANALFEKPVMRVADPFQALRDLARAARFRTHAQVLAVPSRALREALAPELQAAGEIFMMGRHFSQSLASIPDTATLALFGCVSGLRPDLAVITDGSSMQNVILEEMSPRSTVITFANDLYHLEALAWARSARIANIFTLPSRDDPAALAHLILQTLHFTKNPYPASGNVQAFAPQTLAFRVSSLIEFQARPRTVLLTGRSDGPRLQDMQAPFAYLCATGGQAITRRRSALLDEIAPEVLSPGDIVVFEAQKEVAQFAGAFRRAPAMKSCSQG